MSKLLLEKIKYILSWTRKKVELNEMYSNQKTEDAGKPYVNMGDIYFAYLGTNIGAEIDKGRPVLVFQNSNDRYIRQSNMVLTIPISTNTKSTPYKVIIKPEDIIENNGVEESAILIQQIRSISKNRLWKYKGRLNSFKLEEVAIELSKLIKKQNPSVSEGDAQTIKNDAAKSVL
jgi:mRNA-degrading endonuclease toxin of MazEF toxin-antitoxin module